MNNDDTVIFEDWTIVVPDSELNVGAPAESEFGVGSSSVDDSTINGADNSSVLTMQTAIERTKTAGVPIYTIAQGEAVQTPALLKQLTAVSRSTGGVAFAIHGPAEISQVFESVSQDLTHGYLLAFQPPPVEDHSWHPIEVVLRESKGRKVRAREGYFPD